MSLAQPKLATETLFNLGNASFHDVISLMERLGEKRFHAEQIITWHHQKRVDDFDQMTNLSKALRQKLTEHTTLGMLKPEAMDHSGDGTVKFLFKLEDDREIESVFIPEERRNTLCISTQVGCAMGCTFCATALIRPVRNLTAGEIVGQVVAVQRAIPALTPLSNIVLMGMGEPLKNYDQVKKAVEIMTYPFGLAFSGRRITLSTVGLVPEIMRMGQELPINLAISLHAANDEKRSQVMPINRKYPLDTLIRALKQYPLAPRRRITFEYILLKRFNDTLEDAHALAKLLRGIRCKINLIPMNEHAGSSFKRPEMSQILAFQDVLRSYHLTAIIRATRGDDIRAACGQLSGKAAGNFG